MPRRWVSVVVNSIPCFAGDVQDMLGHKAELGEVRVLSVWCLPMSSAAGE